MDTKYFARRELSTGDVLVFHEGMKVPFGRIANCEVAYVFCPEGPYPDHELAEVINAEVEPDATLSEWLAVIRKWSDRQFEDQEKIAAAERHAEGAWLRHAEMGTMESWEQEERDRELDAYFGRGRE